MCLFVWLYTDKRIPGVAEPKLIPILSANASKVLLQIMALLLYCVFLLNYPYSISKAFVFDRVYVSPALKHRSDREMGKGLHLRFLYHLHVCVVTCNKVLDRG